MKKKLYILLLSSLFLQLSNAQEKRYLLENKWGTTIFKSLYDVPDGFGVESGDTAVSVKFYFNQLWAIPIKKKVFVLTGVGLNGYLAGIRNGRKVFKFLERIPVGDYTPTHTDSVSTIIKARYENLYIAVPISFRYVFHLNATESIYLELGMENELLIVSKTSLALKEGAWNIFGNTLKRSTQSDGPVVDFYDKKVNRYAANVFGVLGYDLKITEEMDFALTLSYQRSIIERNQLLIESTGIALGCKLQYAIIR